MHYIYVIVTALFLIVFATFTSANLQGVTIDFWPFEYQINAPFALVALGCLLVGFLVGAFLMWLRFGAARARARRAEQRAAVLERELGELKRSAASAPRGPGGGSAPQLAAPELKAVSGRN
ncbi:lipopolysaccharide assembly protein LapA domain-containing protein [Pelagibius marinus]|uniref:lipopolysaccharide assembly protein LapA domain-containing protein n=1 Tax=Pelagibius marinus TaxID=2762760 RepID=UPI001872340D|nr:LapA family protein [Pelagibius marinus]